MTTDEDSIRERLFDAAMSGDVKGIFYALDDGANPKCNESFALRYAAEHGQVESVKVLLPLSNPKAHWSQALRWAVEKRHGECVKLLVPVSDVEAVRKSMELLNDEASVSFLRSMIEEKNLMDRHEGCLDEMPQRKLRSSV